MSDFGFYDEYDPMAEEEVDPLLEYLAMTLASSEEGMKTSFSRKGGVMEYQDPNQIPNDRMTALKNLAYLQNYGTNPIAFATQDESAWRERIDPYYESPYAAPAYVGMGADDPRGATTNDAVRAIHAGIMEGEDPQKVIAEVQGALGDRWADVDSEFVQRAAQDTVNAYSQRVQNRAAFEAKNQLAPGSALASLGGEELYREKSAGKGLPPGDPFGYEPKGLHMPSMDAYLRSFDDAGTFMIDNPETQDRTYQRMGNVAADRAAAVGGWGKDYTPTRSTGNGNVRHYDDQRMGPFLPGKEPPRGFVVGAGRGGGGGGAPGGRSFDNLAPKRSGMADIAAMRTAKRPENVRVSQPKQVNSSIARDLFNKFAAPRYAKRQMEQVPNAANRARQAREAAIREFLGI